MQTATFDYVIIGAGSAGSVLANRLSADSKQQVLVLEAGPKDRSTLIKIPGAFAYFMYTESCNRIDHWQLDLGKRQYHG